MTDVEILMIVMPLVAVVFVTAIAKYADYKARTHGKG